MKSHLDKTLVGGQTDSDVVLDGFSFLTKKWFQLLYQLGNKKQELTDMY